MDVSGLSAYPVFDALKGTGKDGKFTFPDQASGVAAGRHRPRARVDAPTGHDAARTRPGHLHPGGLYTDLKVTRGGRTKELFRSVAKYFEPAGAVSWDVSMTATKPGWKVARQGRATGSTCRPPTTRARRPGTSRWGSWSSSSPTATGPRRRTRSRRSIDTHGLLTHGHLPENDNHGGKPRPACATRATLLQRTAHEQRRHQGLRLRRRRLQPARQARPPAGGARRGSRSPSRTSTRRRRSRPSSRRTTRSPRARRPVPRPRASPTRSPTRRSSSTRASWATAPPASRPRRTATRGTTPKSLKPGTYTYFCRIHPFMRGAFRVVSDKGK